MTIVATIGSLAALFTTIAFVPQVIRVIRTGDTLAISLWMYLLFCTGLALWLIYGIMMVLWPVILANTVTLALALVVLVYKVSNVRKGKDS